MRRPGYREAIEWIVQNEDTEFVHHDPDSGNGNLTVAASLVCDLFDVKHAKLRADIKLRIAKDRARDARTLR